MPVGETLVHTRVRLLLLCLGVCLSILCLSQATPHQHFTSPEVVIPLKVISRSRGTKSLGWLSYSLRFGGQRHLVHMKVKRQLISTHLPVVTYTEQHALHQTQPFVQNDCYYHGYVDGVSESLVALSTCSGGFRGMLQINELAYEIEPVSLSATFEHLVYKVNIDETQFPPLKCGLTEEEIARQLELRSSSHPTLSQSSYVGWWTHKRAVELLVVVGHDRFLFSQSNVSVVQIQIFNVINVVDSLYHPLDVDVVLTGLQIWNTGNPFSTSGDLDLVVDLFSDWKILGFHPSLLHDTAHLFIKELNGTKLGVAYVRGICAFPYNCGVDVFEDNRIFIFAITVTHELGHNLGMLHDNRWCRCKVHYCIMYPTRQVTSHFSNCSYGDYLDTSMSSGLCIRSFPYPENVFKRNFCGNLIIDIGEECDCGSIRQCAQDPCCQLNCTLMPGASCASGLCCKECKFKPSGTLCRQQIGECDLPEWCNGTSNHCPDDVHVQNGVPCSENAYCYQMTCNNHNVQCKEIFGSNARSASPGCYEINTRGDRFGHCNIVGTVYVKCLLADIMCGRIHCENVDSIPNLPDHSTVHQFPFENTTCWSIDYHLGMSTPDIGQVREGTMCGVSNVCMKRKCANLVLLPQTCQPQTCNMRGVCNNKQHCHCDSGWAPPNCSSKGLGGSEDSGPPPRNPEKSIWVVIVSLLCLCTFLLIVFFVCCFFVLYKIRTKEEKKEGEERKDEGKEEKEEEEVGSLSLDDLSDFSLDDKET